MEIWRGGRRKRREHGGGRRGGELRGRKRDESKTWEILDITKSKI